MYILDFEQPLAKKLQIYDQYRSSDDVDDSKLKDMQKEIKQLEKQIYGNLNPWQITQLARHIDRPGTREFIAREVTDFLEFSGDRMYADDQSIIGGLGTIGGFCFVIVGHMKGKSVAENVRYNFGMPHPEGYRKALRLYELAQRFNLPLLSLIDTPGAYPGIGAEERQQSAAIANCLQVLGRLSVPVIAVVLGEGGSGGALALSVANKILMLKNSIFGVISAEGCSSILWGDASRNKDAAKMLKYTAKDLFDLKIADVIIDEPLVGAHRMPEEALSNVRQAVLKQYYLLRKMTPKQLKEQRNIKFRNMGKYKEAKITAETAVATKKSNSKK